MTKQKIKEITANPAMTNIITEAYQSLQKEKMNRITEIEQKLKSREKEKQQKEEPLKKESSGPLEILDDVLQKKSYTRKDIEILVDKIIVDKDGMQIFT